MAVNVIYYLATVRVLGFESISLSSDAIKLIPQQVPFYRKMFKDSRSYLFTANRRRSVLIARPE